MPFAPHSGHVRATTATMSSGSEAPSRRRSESSTNRSARTRFGIRAFQPAIVRDDKGRIEATLRVRSSTSTSGTSPGSGTESFETGSLVIPRCTPSGVTKPWVDRNGLRSERGYCNSVLDTHPDAMKFTLNTKLAAMFKRHECGDADDKPFAADVSQRLV